MSVDHTPTPWRVGTSDPHAIHRKSRIIAEAKSIDNAAFIVRAVNAHDDLVAALKALAQLVDATPWGSVWAGRPHAQMDAARAALAKAEVQS